MPQKSGALFFVYKLFCDKIFCMSDNIIKSDEVAPKKGSTANKKEIQEQPKEIIEEKPKKSAIPKKKVAAASEGKKFVFFDSGTAYVTKSGFRFTNENRIYEIENEEADHLLSLVNFRLPTQLELEDYHKENN